MSVLCVRLHALAGTVSRDLLYKKLQQTAQSTQYVYDVGTLITDRMFRAWVPRSRGQFYKVGEGCPGSQVLGTVLSKSSHAIAWY